MSRSDRPKAQVPADRDDDDLGWGPEAGQDGPRDLERDEGGEFS